MRRFFALSKERKLLLVEATVSVLRAAYSVRQRPFRETVAKFGRKGVETPQGDGTDEGVETALDVGWAIRAVSRRVPLRATCLVQAEAARMMLTRRELASTLYIGVSTAEKGQDFNGHAWLRCHHVIVTGGKERNCYLTISWFAPPDLP